MPFKNSEEARRAGKKGGLKTKAKFGSEHFSEAGTLGGESCAKKGKAYYAALGQMGRGQGRKGDVTSRDSFYRIKALIIDKKTVSEIRKQLGVSPNTITKVRKARDYDHFGSLGNG